MATPRPPKEVKPSFASDSRAKTRVYLIVGGVVGVFLVALYLQSRHAKDNPALAMQKATVESQPESDGDKSRLRVDEKKGIDQQTITQSAAASYDQTIQSAAKEADAQRKNEEQARQDHYEKQSKEAQDRAVAAATGKVPGSVRADGTAGPSNGAAPPAAPQAARDPRLEVPPEAPFDQRKWTMLGSHRARPAYQTNDIYPADPAAHAELERLYFSGISAPTTVGLETNTLQEMKRLTEDFAGAKGSVGVRPSARLPRSSVGAVTPKKPIGSGEWGDWITVTPLPKGTQVEPKDVGEGGK